MLLLYPVIYDSILQARPGVQGLQGRLRACFRGGFSIVLLYHFYRFNRTIVSLIDYFNKYGGFYRLRL